MWTAGRHGQKAPRSLYRAVTPWLVPSMDADCETGAAPTGCAVHIDVYLTPSSALTQYHGVGNSDAKMDVCDEATDLWP